MYRTCEHLIIGGIDREDYSSKHQIAYTLGEWLVELGALMLADYADVDRMELIADGEKKSFSGDCPDQNYKNLIGALSEAENIEFTAYYGINTEAYSPKKAFQLESVVSELSPADLTGVFYSVYRNADYALDEVSLNAYGVKGNKSYHGEVAFEKFPEPTGGPWSADNDIVFCASDLSPEQVENAARICRELNTLCNYNIIDLSVEENEIDYYMVCSVLGSIEDYHKLTALYAELHAISEKVTSVGEYSDLSGADARIMRISYDESCTPVVEIAEL